MATLLQNIADMASKLARVSNVHYSKSVDQYREEVHIYIDNNNMRHIEVVEFGHVVWGLCVKGLSVDDAMKEICNIINQAPVEKAEWVKPIIDENLDDDFSI